MEILEAFDLTGSFRDAAELAGSSHHTVAAHVAARDAGRGWGVGATRPQLIDEYLAKIEEWVEHSAGKVRADKAHEKLLTLGYAGSERTTRRAVAAVRKDYRLGRVRVHRPWVTEPGMWVRYDFGDGPVIDGVRTTLFCAWLAWSRFRVVLAIRDKTMPSVVAALVVTLRRLGGSPTYVLTDNEKTVTVEHVAGMAVRNPQMVAFARHYGVTVHTCEPADPASKGGSESTVKLAKADLVPKDTNLLEEYSSFAELEAACVVFCEEVNTRVHRVTRRPPVEMLSEEQARLHPVPADPHTVAFGLTRTVPTTMPMVSFEGGQYSVPHTQLGQTAWVRVHGRGADEQVIIVHIGAFGPVEVARHRRARPGSPRDHRRAPPASPHRGIGPQASREQQRRCRVPRPRGGRPHVAVRRRPRPGRRRCGSRWPRHSGCRSCSTPPRSTGHSGAAVHGQFAEADLASILDHHAAASTGQQHRAGEDHSLTQGTSAWARLKTRHEQPVAHDNGVGDVEGEVVA